MIFLIVGMDIVYHLRSLSSRLHCIEVLNYTVEFIVDGFCPTVSSFDVVSSNLVFQAKKTL